MAVKPIPEGYHSVTPYLILDDATRALEFYKKALGAVELLRMPAPGGRIGHAEIRIGDSPIMLADESPEMGAKSARTIGGSPISLMVGSTWSRSSLAATMASSASSALSPDSSSGSLLSGAILLSRIGTGTGRSSGGACEPGV